MCATAARYLWQKLPVVKEVVERFSINAFRVTIISYETVLLLYLASLISTSYVDSQL